MVVIYIYNVVYTKFIFNFRYPSEYSKYKSSMHTKINFPDAGVIRIMANAWIFIDEQLTFSYCDVEPPVCLGKWELGFMY